MLSISDRDYLLGHQYRTGSNLNARIALHTRFSTNPYGWYRWFFDLLGELDGRQILEIGTGTGKLWAENVDRLPGDVAVTLSDLSSGMLDEARTTLGDDADRFTFAIVDAQDIPFDGSTFDVVIANYMLYHVPDRSRALAEMRRVLRPGGRFFCTLNGRAHMAEIRSLLDELGAPFFSDTGRFTLEDAEELIQEHFEHVELKRYEDSLEVTEVEPLIDYALSTAARDALLQGTRLESLRSRLQAVLREHGIIRITKDSGTFEARRV